jgi:hypothetical protein
MKGDRRSTALAAVVLFAASYLFRLPPLLNARSTNSDAAVVGLQALHILRGEHSAFLWGSGYQTSVDAYVAAAFFAVFGKAPVVLMLSALTLHVLATFFVWGSLRRHFSPWTALLVSLPLVVAPSSVHTYALYPPRQASLTIALAAFWALDAAGAVLLREGDRYAKERRARVWLLAGGALSTLAIAADPYPMLLLPLALGFALLVGGTRRVLWAAIGAAAGIVPFIVLHRMAGAKEGPMGLTLAALGHHFDLLVGDCLPWALSYKVYFAHNVMDYRPWDAPLVVRGVMYLGALSVVAVVTYAFVAMPLRSLSWPIRRLGLVGAITYPLAIGAFLTSVMVMDHFSMRYLVVLTLMLPFAAAPLARALGGKRFALLFAPHLVASAIGGWVGYGPFVRGPLPVRETPELRDDYTLFHMLRARGITYATADYWASYRLTLLFSEEIVVVPKNDSEDRYAPYRRALENAPVFAYVFDPGRSREDLGEAEKTLRAKYKDVEKTAAGGHTVFIVHR